MAVLGIGAKKFVLLQERDLALFRWVSEQKFASQEQIQRRFWPNEKEGVTRPDRVCYRRLCALVRFGFLERRHVVTDRVQLYQLGRAGLRELEARGELVLPHLPSIDLKNYQHDLRVNEFRILLEQMGGYGWQSDRRIRQAGARSHTPDALFRLGENRCALEMARQADRASKRSWGTAVHTGRHEQASGQALPEPLDLDRPGPSPPVSISGTCQCYLGSDRLQAGVVGGIRQSAQEQARDR